MRGVFGKGALVGATLTLVWAMPAAAQGGALDDPESFRAAQEYIETVEAAFAAMERARLDGDCAAFQAARDEASVHITAERPIGVVEAEPANALEARLRDLAARPCPANASADRSGIDGSGTMAAWSGLGLAATYGRIDAPVTGIGFIRDGAPGEAPELPAGESDSDFESWGGEGYFYIPGTETLLRLGRPLRIGFGYEEGTGRSRFDVASGTYDATGWPYGAESESGSTGIGTPGFGLGGTLELDYSSWWADLGVPLLGEDRPKSAPVRVDLVGGFRRYDWDYRSFIWFREDFGGFTYEASQERDQRVNENVYSLGLDGELAIPLGGRLVGHLGSYTGAYYADRELASVEWNLSNFGPADDRDFTLELDDSNNGWGFRGELRAALEFVVSPRVSIVTGGSLDYRSDIGALWNPTSGDEVLDGLTTQLRTQDALSWKVGAGLTVRYGGGG